MKSIKKLVVIILLGCAVLALAGCELKQNSNYTIKPGKIIADSTIAMDEELYENLKSLSTEEDGSEQEIFDEGVKVRTKTVNGTKYYCGTERKSFSFAAFEKTQTNSTKDAAAEFIFLHISNNAFVGVFNKKYIAQYSDMGIDFTDDISVTFPKRIVATNGKLSADRKTVKFSNKQLKKGKLIDAQTSKKITAFKIKGVKDGASYTGSVTIKRKSGTGSMYLDGKRIESGKIVKKKGKHTLVTLGANGVKKTYKFSVVK